MDDNEIFAKISLDPPIQNHDMGDVGVAQTVDEAVWRQPISMPVEYDSNARLQLSPRDGEPYRMVAMADLLAILHITNDGDGYLDDTAQVLVHTRLQRLGLALATTIIGPLRLRCTDIVPVVDADQPRPTRYSTITICLYLVAWMLEGDGATARDLAIVDAWIDGYDPKEQWGGAAQGTFRWLLSRKLILTYKRKQRMGRIKRYPNVRNRLMDVLLHLVSDPEHVTAKRMARLQTIYASLGLNPADIHADIHRMATVAPVAVKSKGQNMLDANRLKQIEASTRKAQAVLADVFADVEAQTPVIEEKTTESPLTALLRHLAQKPEWTRDEAEGLVRGFGMTLGAALERLNDMSYDATDDPVADDDGDAIYIDQQIAGELID